MHLHRVLSSGTSELAALAGDCCAQNLKAFFNARLAAWPDPLNEVEGGGLDVFEDLRGSLKSPDALKLIPASLKIVLAQNDPLRRESAAALALTLARTSETTQMPLEAEEAWSALLAQSGITSGNPGRTGSHLDELKRWAASR